MLQGGPALLRRIVLTRRQISDYHPVRLMLFSKLTMHRLVSAGVVLAALLAVCACASADAPRHQRKGRSKEQVEQMEQSWRTAQLAGDVAAMDKLLADDYVGITMTGQVVTKLQQLDRMRNRELLLTRIDLEDVKVKLIGATAVVTCLADVDGSNDGIPMHGRYRYTRVYSRTPGGIWKITNFEATRVAPPGPRQGRGGPDHRGPNQGEPDRPSAGPGGSNQP
jgi:ketosteroid isomerase-like protein